MFRIVATNGHSSVTAVGLGRLLRRLPEFLPPRPCFVSSWETVMVPQDTLGPLGATVELADLADFLEPAEFHFEWLSVLYPRPPFELVPDGTDIVVDGETHLWDLPPHPLFETSTFELYIFDINRVILLGHGRHLATRLHDALRGGDPAAEIEEFTVV